jgi:hypothetical protein
MHFRVTGKRSKIRFIPANPAALRLIDDYLARAGHSEDLGEALFCPVANNRRKTPFYLYLADVSVPLLGTSFVGTPQITGDRSIVHFILFLLCFYFAFVRKPKA